MLKTHTYAVAVLDFYSNENKVHVVKAVDAPDAMIKALGYEPTDFPTNVTVDDITASCFDNDIAVSHPVQLSVEMLTDWR